MKSVTRTRIATACVTCLIVGEASSQMPLYHDAWRGIETTLVLHGCNEAYTRCGSLSVTRGRDAQGSFDYASLLFREENIDETGVRKGRLSCWIAGDLLRVSPKAETASLDLLLETATCEENVQTRYIEETGLYEPIGSYSGSFRVAVVLKDPFGRGDRQTRLYGENETGVTGLRCQVNRGMVYRDFAVELNGWRIPSLSFSDAQESACAMTVTGR